MHHPNWLTWAKRIEAIAQTGLTYGKDAYDLERFQELRAIAAAMLGAHTGTDGAAWLQALRPEHGYPTPKVDVRAVVFDDQGKLLLVRERSEGLWSLPGGWADCGDSPGETAAKEVREESGFLVRPTKLLAAYDRNRHPHPPFFWDVYKLFIRCELLGGQASESLETDGVGFFAESGTKSHLGTTLLCVRRTCPPVSPSGRMGVYHLMRPGHQCRAGRRDPCTT